MKISNNFYIITVLNVSLLFVIRTVLIKRKYFISEKYGEAKRVNAEVSNEGGFQVCTVVLHLSVPNFCSFRFDIEPVLIQLLKDMFDRYLTFIMFLRIFGFTFQQWLK